MTHKLFTILLVEDEPEVQFELKKFLQRYSTDVITANNGEEGLALYMTHTPDIVVSDIKMPKMNGITMAKKIKKHSPEQVIIFTTAHSDSKYFLEAIELQVDGYILKPVDLNLLAKKINDIQKNIELQREKKLYVCILDDIAQMQDAMLAVYDKNNLPVFYNKKLLAFLGYVSIQGFLEEHTELSEKFDKKEEYFYPKINSQKSWVEEIREKKVDKRIVSMQGEHELESKLFLVSLSEKIEHKHSIVTFSEITSIVEEKYQYMHDAHTDELTQIGNRTRFNILLDNALRRTKKEKNNLGIILLDIDNFKHVNDTYGHAFGDKVLKNFATLILDNIRAEDSFSRWGGEEFVLLLSDTTLKNTKNMAENLRMIIEKYDFGIHKKLTSSFGITISHDMDTSKSLFARVDKALYSAKHNGKNRVEVSI